MKPNNYFVSVNNIDFNNKGNPNEIRAFIPAEVKENQRSSHFKVGFENQSPYVHLQERPAASGFVKSVNAPLAPIKAAPQAKKHPTAKELNSQSHVFTQQLKPAGA